MKEQIQEFKKILKETYFTDYILRNEDPEHVGEIKRRIAVRNYKSFPPTAIMVLLITAFFIISDTTSGFYQENYPFSLLNLSAEIIHSLVLPLLLIHFLDKREKDAKIQLIYSRLYLLLTAAGCSLYLLSDTMRGVDSSTPYFSLILLVIVPILFEKEFLFFYGIYLIPTFIYYIISRSADVFTMILNFGGYFLHLYLLTSYVRELLLNIKYEESHAQLMRMNRTDFLTKIGNRKLLYETIDKNRERWTAEKKDICLIMMDIDNFKCYNDTYSHLQGDDCLVRVSAAINKTIDKHPLTEITFIRFGGEEFLMMLAGDQLEKVMYAIYEDIRSNVEALAIPSGSGAMYPYVTVSAGAAMSGFSDSLVIEELMLRADEQLYLAKKNGRDALGYQEKIYRQHK